jgi:UDPglucose 6-dehydrogenase
LSDLHRAAEDLDYGMAYATMPKPAYIFDGRMILDHQKLKAIGFDVEVIGKRV